MTNDALEFWGLSGPTLAMCGVALLLAGNHLYQAIFKPKKQRGRRRVGLFVPSAALGFAFMTLPTIYRPSVDLIVKAQIRQQEDADDDGNGDPDNPARRLHRQLRRIRRGLPVDRIVIHSGWRPIRTGL